MRRREASALSRVAYATHPDRQQESPPSAKLLGLDERWPFTQFDSRRESGASPVEEQIPLPRKYLRPSYKTRPVWLSSFRVAGGSAFPPGESGQRRILQILPRQKIIFRVFSPKIACQAQ